MTTDDPGSVPLPSRRALKELRERALASTDRKERRRLLDEWHIGQARRRFDQTARQLLRSGDPRAAALAASIAAHAGTTLPAPQSSEPAPVAVRPFQPRQLPPVVRRPERPTVPDLDPDDTRPAAVILTDVFDCPPELIGVMARLDEATLNEKVLRIADRHPAMADLIRRALVEHQAHDDDAPDA